VLRDSKSHTGLSIFVLGADGEHAGFLERGANDNYRFEGFGGLKKSRWFYVSSLTGEADNSLSKIFSYANKKKIKVAFNPGSKQLKQGLVYLRPFLAQTEVLLLNLDEAKELLKRTKTDLNKMEEILKALAECGPKIVVITAGKAGSWAYTEGKMHHQPAAPVKVVDTTGAGDSFGSTFLFGTIKGFATPYCLKIASVNAASVVSAMGAGSGLLTYNKVKSSKWL
jgi:ribokinase